MMDVTAEVYGFNQQGSVIYEEFRNNQYHGICSDQEKGSKNT